MSVYSEEELEEVRKRIDREVRRRRQIDQRRAQDEKAARNHTCLAVVAGVAAILLVILVTWAMFQTGVL